MKLRRRTLNFHKNYQPDQKLLINQEKHKNISRLIVYLHNIESSSHVNHEIENFKSEGN